MVRKCSNLIDLSFYILLNLSFNFTLGEIVLKKTLRVKIMFGLGFVVHKIIVIVKSISRK